MTVSARQLIGIYFLMYLAPPYIACLNLLTLTTIDRVLLLSRFRFRFLKELILYIQI